MPAPETLIPPAMLQSSGKILFVTHLAIGDFTYLHNYFEALSKARPKLELHIWVDDIRRTNNPTKWDDLKKYSLYDWLASCHFFKKTYNETYSPELYEKSIAEARAQNYPIVVSLAILRPHRYAMLARQISPAGYVIGTQRPLTLAKFYYYFAYKKLDASLPSQTAMKQNIAHITEVFDHWFILLFGIGLPPQQRLLELNFPVKWAVWAANFIHDWPINGNMCRLVLINNTAKAKQRCWPLASAMQLIKDMRQTPAWANARFLLNTMPADFEPVSETIRQNGLDNVRAFTAGENFFQLPAILAECDLVISVETAVMHLACAVRVPVVALMRRKNPEWAPLDSANSTVITPPRRADWVNAIRVESVIATLQRFRAAPLTQV